MVATVSWVHGKYQGRGIRPNREVPFLEILVISYIWLVIYSLKALIIEKIVDHFCIVYFYHNDS